MKINISIVVATNNRKNINSFINQILFDLPNDFEIIIVIPVVKKKIFRTISYSHNRLKILYSKYENQVKQRIDGFKIARGSFVLQSDDDIILKIDDILKLKNELINYPNSCVAPSLGSDSTPSTWMNSPIYFNSLFYKLISYINHGAQLYEPGKFSKAGINMAFDVRKKKSYEVEWLPGGCILHNKKNLILQNYYPFHKGKSFSEDLFHSKYLTSFGLKLVFAPNIKIKFSNTNSKKLNIVTFKEIILNIRAMNRFVNQFGGNKIRLNMTLTLYYFWLFFYKLINK